MTAFTIRVNKTGALLQPDASTPPTVTTSSVADLSGYQTTAGLAVNVATLTANSASYIGSTAAANVVTTTTLAANIAIVNTAIVANGAAAYSNAVSYVVGQSFATQIQLSANLANYQTIAGLSANVAGLTANNTTFVGSVSAANVVSNAQLQANITAINTNITSNAAAAYSNAVAYVDGQSFVDSTELAANLVNYQTTAGLAANVAVLNANNAMYVGGANLATIESNIVANGSAAYTNAVAYVDGKSYVNTSQLSTNLANYQTTAGLAANVATLASNNATFAYGKNEGNLNVNSALSANSTSYLESANLQNIQTYITSNAGAAYTNAVSYVDGKAYVNTSQLSSNLANYQTTAGLAANVATLTSNNATNFAGQPGSFYTNAENLSSGILPNARLSTAIVNTSGDFTIAGIRTFNANIIFGTNTSITANGSVGLAGQVLTSNGSTVFWSRLPYNITVDFTQGSTPANGTITLDNGTSSSITINDVIHTIGNNSGNLQFTVQFLFANGSTQNVDGLTAVTCNTSSRTTTTATSNNTANTGTVVQLVIANTSGSPNNASITIRGTRP